jgi:hypothetical protein
MAMDHRPVELVADLADGNKEIGKQDDAFSVSALELTARVQIRGEMSAKMMMNVRQRSHWRTNRA